MADILDIISAVGTWFAAVLAIIALFGILGPWIIWRDLQSDKHIALERVDDPKHEFVSKGIPIWGDIYIFKRVNVPDLTQPPKLDQLTKWNRPAPDLPSRTGWINFLQTLEANSLPMAKGGRLEIWGKDANLSVQRLWFLAFGLLGRFSHRKDRGQGIHINELNASRLDHEHLLRDPSEDRLCGIFGILTSPTLYNYRIIFLTAYSRQIQGSLSPDEIPLSTLFWLSLGFLPIPSSHGYRVLDPYHDGAGRYQSRVHERIIHKPTKDDEKSRAETKSLKSDISEAKVSSDSGRSIAKSGKSFDEEVVDIYKSETSEVSEVLSVEIVEIFIRNGIYISEHEGAAWDGFSGPGGLGNHQANASKFRSNELRPVYYHAAKNGRTSQRHKFHSSSSTESITRPSTLPPLDRKPDYQGSNQEIEESQYSTVPGEDQPKLVEPQPVSPETSQPGRSMPEPAEPDTSSAIDVKLFRYQQLSDIVTSSPWYTWAKSMGCDMETVRVLQSQDLKDVDLQDYDRIRAEVMSSLNLYEGHNNSPWVFFHTEIGRGRPDLPHPFIWRPDLHSIILSIISIPTTERHFLFEPQKLDFIQNFFGNHKAAYPQIVTALRKTFQYWSCPYTAASSQEFRMLVDQIWLEGCNLFGNFSRGFSSETTKLVKQIQAMQPPSPRIVQRSICILFLSSQDFINFVVEVSKQDPELSTSQVVIDTRNNTVTTKLSAPGSSNSVTTVFALDFNEVFTKEDIPKGFINEKVSLPTLMLSCLDAWIRLIWFWRPLPSLPLIEYVNSLDDTNYLSAKSVGPGPMVNI